MSKNAFKPLSQGELIMAYLMANKVLGTVTPDEYKAIPAAERKDLESRINKILERGPGCARRLLNSLFYVGPLEEKKAPVIRNLGVAYVCDLIDYNTFLEQVKANLPA